MSTLTQEFERRAKELEKRAKAAGSNMTQVCKATGLARATWERWHARAPQNVHKFDDLEKEVSRLEREAQKAAP